MGLNILSASAGSGKTYRLSREFVQTCLQSADPSYAGTILAMTFTNKATGEMKSRILELLRNIAIGGEVIKPHDLLYPLQKSIGEEEMKRRADLTLRFLLKNYHQFSVSTIDSFFQQIIRQFQRELNLNQPFTVELDTNRVLDDAVNNLLEGLTPESDEFRWIIQWVGEKLEAGKSWDIRVDLKNLGSELFKEGVTDEWGEIDIPLFKDLLTQMKTFIDEVDAFFENNKEELRKLLNQAEVTPDEFKGKSRSFVVTWLNADDIMVISEKKNFIEALDPDNWFSKGKDAIAELKIQPYEQQILILQEQVIQKIEEDLYRYNSYNLALSKFRTYIALRFLYKSVQDITSEQDIMLLSEANKLVKKVVDGSDISLLYEKSGQKYQHIMVDEFQDTSGSQWNNLKPLFEQSLSMDKSSLIVGDIKQAIYRWRSGDWQIMHSRLNQDLMNFREMILAESLEQNFRSATAVVTFNNELFPAIIESLKSMVLHEYAPHDLVDAIDTIYEGIRQEAVKPLNLSGGVEIDILKATNEEETENEEDTSEKYLLHRNWLHEKLKSLLTSGYLPGDITILVRKSKEAASIIEWMQQWEYEDGNRNRFLAISENGFLLKNSPAVQLLVYALKFKLYPRNPSVKPSLLEFWSVIHKEDNPAHKTKNEDLNFPEFLRQLFAVRITTLYEWFSSLIRDWELQDVSVAHLCTFLDQIRLFEVTNGSDPHAFLEWWSSKEDTLGVPSDEKISAIQVMTIHKSKGLQFPVVILPFMDEPIIKSMNDDNLYVFDKEDPLLKQLGVVPVREKKNVILKSYFAGFYIEERILKAIDSLNLLYVATTRSVQRLLIAVDPVTFDKKSGKKSCKNIGDLLQISLSEEDFVNGKYLFGDTDYRPWPADEHITSIDRKPISSLHIRNKIMSTGAWLDKELPVAPMSVESEELQQLSATQYGTLLHAIMERLQNIESLDQVIQLLVEEGMLNEAHTEFIKSKAAEFLQHEQVRSWYASGQAIYAEKEIIEIDGKSYRPDRVILEMNKTILIDFKTGKKSTSYNKQLLKYSDLLQRMGLPEVEPWIAYIDSSEFIQISSN